MAAEVGLVVAFFLACGLAILLLRTRAIQLRSKEARPAATAALAESKFAVPGMVCEGCAEKITDALKAIPGVCEIKPKLAQKQIVVRYEPALVAPGDLKGALAAAGFKALET